MSHSSSVPALGGLPLILSCDNFRTLNYDNSFSNTLHSDITINSNGYSHNRTNSSSLFTENSLGISPDNTKSDSSSPSSGENQPVQFPFPPELCQFTQIISTSQYPNSSSTSESSNISDSSNEPKISLMYESSIDNESEFSSVEEDDYDE
jgi:hypothetical protein